jgi:hypothetical protein
MGYRGSDDRPVPGMRSPCLTGGAGRSIRLDGRCARHANPTGGPVQVAAP